MYEDYIKRRVDEEAETRARRRFDHFRETFGPTAATTPPTGTTLPSAELILGARGPLTRFVEATISTANTTNLKMFLEMARERLIEKWSPLESEVSIDADGWITKRMEIYRDDFVPALDSTVDLGLQIVKYDASSEWLGLVVSLLIEAFEECRIVDRQGANIITSRPGTLPFARPAYDLYVGARTLATYAVMRERFRYLREILPRYTRFITPSDSSQVFIPLLFWPFSGVTDLPDMRHGRNEALWNARIKSAWGEYFGGVGRFKAAASQLEFILEFNSYIFEGVNIPEVKKLQEGLGDKHFAYLPDFWASRLDPVVPIADHFYDALAKTEDFPGEFAVEKAAMDLVFKGKDGQRRLLFLGCYLVHLKSSQAQMMMQQHRFPFMFDWDGRLKAIAENCARAKKGQQGSTGSI